MNIGILAPTRGELIRSPKHPSFDNVIRMAELVEAERYHSIWVGDSVTAKPRFEAMTSLAAIAARTKKAKLGTSVLLSGLRNPVVLGQQVATLDVISGGRLILGLGVGGGESRNLVTEFPASGVPYEERVDFFEQGIETMKKVWTRARVRERTKWYQLDDVTVEPKPVQKPYPPIWIAGAHMGERKKRQMERIARQGDGFVSTLITPQEYHSVLGEIRDLAAAMGRKSSEIHACLYMSVNIDSDRRKAAAEGNAFLEKYYGYSFWGDRWGPFGTAAEQIKSIQTFVDAGVQTFVVRFAAEDQEKQLAEFTKEVFPSFR